MNDLTCVWKKSASREYGIIDIKNVASYDLVWVRCMTCKEALKKIEADNTIKYAVIEDAREKDTETINEIMRTGVRVILLGGDLVLAGVTLCMNSAEVADLLLRLVNGEVEDSKSEAKEEALEERVEQLKEMTSGSQIDLNGIDYAKYEAIVAERNRFRNLYETTKEELNSVKNIIDTLMVDEDVIEYISSGVDGRALENELKTANAEIERLKRKIDDLGAARSEHRTTELQLNQANDELTKAKLVHTADTEALDILRQTIVQVSYYGREIIDELSQAHTDVRSAEENAASYANKEKDALDKLSAANGRITELEGEIAKLADSLESVKESNEELSLDIVQLEKEKDNLNGELTAVRDKLNEEKNKEEKTLDLVEEKEQELAELRSYKIEDMEAEIAQSREMLAEYAKAMAELRVSNDAYKEENAELKQQVSNYSEMADKAHNKMVAHDRLTAGDYGTVLNIDYRGKAMVVAVFGSGGHGTTAVATAIAERLVSNGNDVALVDYDFRSPKMDAVYNINPFIDGLSDMIVSELRRTSVGALIKLGGKKWADYFNRMGKVVNQNKGRGEGNLVYHSGCYECLTSVEITNADYDTMLRKLGIEFDYIVLDMGRLEGSGAIANFQAGISNCANQNFLVTSCTYADIRSTNVRAINSRMKMNNTCWVTNMKTGKLTPAAEKIVESAESSVEIPFVKDSYGEEFSLAENRKTCNGIDLLCAYIK